MDGLEDEISGFDWLEVFTDDLTDLLSFVAGGLISFFLILLLLLLITGEGLVGLLIWGLGVILLGNLAYACFFSSFTGLDLVPLLADTFDTPKLDDYVLLTAFLWDEIEDRSFLEGLFIDMDSLWWDLSVF